MKKPYPGMPIALTALTTLLDNVLRTPIARLDADGIREARERTYPSRGPIGRITGVVDRSVRISGATASARDGHAIPLRVYRPSTSAPDLPVVVWYHGGGFAIGSPVQYDAICAHLAAQVPAVVVSVDYRLAPEHKAPYAAYDCIDAARWVVAHAADLGADGTRLAVAGDSAGGNLAAVVAQAFRDAGRSEIRHQALLYPATDMTKTSPSIKEHALAPILTEEAIDVFLGHYLDGSEVAPTDPIVSPLFGDLEGLPAALIQTADLDPIRDDGIRYAAALAAAGVRVRHTNYVRMPHGFASMPGVTGIARQHQAELVGELAAHLHPSRQPAPAAR